MAIVLLILGGDDQEGGGGSGDFQIEFGFVPDGAVFDDREGAEPPPVADTSLDSAAEAAGCNLQRDLPDEGSEHFADEDEKGEWETNPPTSGEHYGVPTENASGALADGPYLEMPSLARAVHAMEHGRVIIHYSPELPQDEQLELKGIYDADAAGVILMPNEDMPFAVAATAWTQLIGCDGYEGAPTLDAFRDFVGEFRGRGRERFPF